MYYGEPSPYNPYQEIYLDFIPVAVTLTMESGRSGSLPSGSQIGAFDIEVPAGNVLNSGTGFLNPVEETTLHDSLYSDESDHCRGIRCEI
mgnify:CR=1 FL=1